MKPNNKIVHRLSTAFFVALLLGIFVPTAVYASDVQMYVNFVSGTNFNWSDGTVPNDTINAIPPSHVAEFNKYYGTYPDTSMAIQNVSGSCGTGFGDMWSAFNNDTLESLQIGNGDYWIKATLCDGRTYFIKFTRFSSSNWTTPTPPPVDTTTRIDTVDPASLQTIATSSLPYDFEANGYVNNDDFETGARLMLKLDRNTDQQAVGALAAFDSAFGNKTYFPISPYGSFTVGTSSDNLKIDFPLRVGLYNAYWEIQVPRFSVFGLNLFYTTLVASSTQFTIATTTAIDNITINQTEYLQGILDASGDPLASCHFSLFDSALDLTLGSSALDCVAGILHWMFVLPNGVLATTMTQLKNGFLTRVPIGYFTRVVSAINGGAEGTLPDVHADIPIPNTNGDISGSISLDFDIDQIVNDSADLQDSFQTPDGHTARSIIEPIIQMIVGLIVLMFIYNDLYGTFRRL